MKTYKKIGLLFVLFVIFLFCGQTSCSEEDDDNDDPCECTSPPAGVESEKSCFAQGETMPAQDGCNTCTCDNGDWMCTLMGCEDDDDDNDDDNNNDDDTFETLVYVDDLPVMRLKGDAYSRGYEMGSLVGDQIVYLYQEYVLNYALGLSEEYSALFKIVKNFACSMILFQEEEMEQIQGIADGVKDNWDTRLVLSDDTEIEFNENDICIANAIADFSQIACSSVSVWGALTDDQETIIARNLDWEPGPDALLPDHTLIVSETPDDESWHLVNITFPGMLGCLSCINGDGQGVFIHDTARYHDHYKVRLEPRAMLLRRALISAENAADPLATFESSLEAGQIDTGNNFHFVQSAANSDDGAVCFEMDDNENHGDGFVTGRIGQDTDASEIEQTDAMIVTNHHRKRYPPGNCWRYESIAQSIQTAAFGLTMDDLHTMMKDVEFETLTIHTILFKPSDWTLDIYRMRPDHLASEDSGVSLPVDLLFPWYY